MEIKVKLRKQKPIIYDVKLYSDFNYSILYIGDSTDNYKGMLSFSFKNDIIYINKIETKKECQHQGIGTALIKSLEYIAYKNNIKSIEGKYYPENEYACTFYEKLGYYVPNQTKSWDNYDETWTLFKVLDYSKIKSTFDKELEDDEKMF